MGLNVSQSIEKIKNEIDNTNEINNIIKFLEESNRGII